MTYGQNSRQHHHGGSGSRTNTSYNTREGTEKSRQHRQTQQRRRKYRAGTTVRVAFVLVYSLFQVRTTTMRGTTTHLTLHYFHQSLLPLSRPAGVVAIPDAVPLQPLLWGEGTVVRSRFASEPTGRKRSHITYAARMVRRPVRLVLAAS